MAKNKVNWIGINTTLGINQQVPNYEFTEVNIQRYNPKIGRLFSRLYTTITHSSFIRLTRWIGENTE